MDSIVQAFLFTTMPILPYAIMTSSALSGLIERDKARVFVAPVTDATVAVVVDIVDTSLDTSKAFTAYNSSLFVTHGLIRNEHVCTVWDTLCHK